MRLIRLLARVMEMPKLVNWADYERGQPYDVLKSEALDWIVAQPEVRWFILRLFSQRKLILRDEGGKYMMGLNLAGPELLKANKVTEEELAYMKVYVKARMSKFRKRNITNSIREQMQLARYGSRAVTTGLGILKEFGVVDQKKFFQLIRQRGHVSYQVARKAAKLMAESGEVLVNATGQYHLMENGSKVFRPVLEMIEEIRKNVLDKDQRQWAGGRPPNFEDQLFTECLPEEGCTTVEWSHQVMQETGMSRATFFKRMRDLKERKLVEKRDKLWFKLPPEKAEVSPTEDPLLKCLPPDGVTLADWLDEVEGLYGIQRRDFLHGLAELEKQGRVTRSKINHRYYPVQQAAEPTVPASEPSVQQLPT